MNYVKEELEKLSIHHLREIAREMGVKSPSSQIKKNLVEEILDVSNGAKQPHFTKNGRPSIKNEQQKPCPNVIIQEKIIEKTRNINEEKIATIIELINSCVRNIFNVLNESEV